MYLTQAIKRNAQVNHKGIATIRGGRRKTWPELVERVSRLAGALRTLGVTGGDRVAILALNSDRYYEYAFACWWVGAVVVPMNIRWSAAENAYSLNDSGARIIFIDETFVPQLDEIAARTEHALTVIDLENAATPPGMLGYEALIRESEPIEDACRGGEDLAGIFYTGGTTGFPKGVMLPHRAMWASAVSLAYHGRLDSSCRYLHAAPMFHLADFALSLASTLGGSTHVFIPAFEPRKALQAMNEHAVSHVVLVPTMIQMVLHAMEEEAIDDIPSLELVFFGASPMTTALLEHALNKLPKAQWSQLYGQTELAPLATFQPPEFCTLDGPDPAKLNSAGQAGLCVELRIVNEDNEEVPRGEVGEVIVRGANTMLGYWNKPEETATALVDGWVHTGDAAYMDDDGFIFIADRLKDMIITGGENVFTAEVESAVASHPAVDQCVVIGIPSEKWGESVHAIVIAKEGEEVTGREIIEHSRKLIAHYKCPSSVEFRTEPFPISGAGKVLKRDLREPFWQGKDRRVN